MELMSVLKQYTYYSKKCLFVYNIHLKNRSVDYNP